MHVVSNIIRNKSSEMLEGVQDDHEKMKPCQHHDVNFRRTNINSGLVAYLSNKSKHYFYISQYV